MAKRAKDISVESREPSLEQHSISNRFSGVSLSQEMFAKAFYKNPIPMAIRMLDGQFVEVNNCFLNCFGYERNEVIGHTIQELNSWVIPQERNLMEQRVKEQGGFHGFEAKYRTKSGGIRDCMVSVELLSMGREPYLISVVRDITEHKKIMEALHYSEDRFSKAYNASPLTMSITTMEDGKFISVNDSFCRIIGYSSEEILGKTSFDPGFWFDRNERYRMLQMIKDNGSVRDMKIRFLRKSGEVRLGFYSAERIDINGEACLLSILSDMTEQFNWAEERQKLKEQTDRVYRLLTSNSESAGIIHEIAQPINAIKLLVDGFLYWHNIQECFETEELVDMLRSVSLEISRVEKTIEQVRSITRKGQSMEIVPCNLNEAVDEAIRMFEFEFSDCGIFINKELLDNLPEVPGNPKWLMTVVRNLLDNAVHALNKTGKQHKAIWCYTRLINNTVILEVADNASGIKNELLGHVFEPFYSTKNREENMGLGLAIVESIVTSCSGRIRVFNNDKGGATFWAELPVWDESISQYRTL